MKKNILNFTLTEFKAELEKNEIKPFRGQQIFEWIYKKDIFNFENMTNLPEKMRNELARSYTINLPKIKHIAHSKADNSYKLLLESRDKKLIESILMIYENRITLCVSCMIGCPLKCAFCATGSEIGFIRKLTCAEIIGQVVVVQQYMKENVRRNPSTGSGRTGSSSDSKQTDKITNVVFMGMGEPFLNIENVEKSIEILRNDFCFGIAKSKITVSTSGVEKDIAAFINKHQVALAVSLHFPTNELRNKYMPVNQNFPLEKLIEELKKIKLTKRQSITIEYMMLDKINDTLTHAKQLVKLLNVIKVKINLIPYNPIKSFDAKPSTKKNIEIFADYLKSKNIFVFVRLSKGTEFEGGCGQFAFKKSV